MAFHLSKKASLFKNRAGETKDTFYQSFNSLTSKRLRKSFLSVLFFSLLFISTPARAENPPPGQDTGPQAERFKFSSEKEKRRFEQKKTTPPEIEIQKEAEKKPAAQAISFTLKAVKITGLTIFQPADFLGVYQSYLEKIVTFQDLDLVVGKIKERYKQKGYLTTTVYIPEQEIKEGAVEIKVVEGKMGQLSVEGNKWFSSPLIEKYFHTKKNEILNIQNLQKDILRLNQNPDLEVKTIISAGKLPETSDLILKVTERYPWHSGIGFDNQGSRLSGKLQSSVYLRGANVSGIGDTLFLNSAFSSLTFGQSLSYLAPLNTYGTKIGLDATYFKMKLGKEFKSNEITGTTEILAPHLSFELALEENFQANADLGMDLKSIIKKADGDRTSDDQLREPFFSFNFTRQDSFGQTFYAPRFTFGTAEFLGASSRNHPSASRAGTGGAFFKYGQSLNRVQRMPGDSYLSLRSQFQSASRSLPSSEQFQLGGANSVRGYPEGDYLCDLGGTLSAEWVMPLYLIPPDWKLPRADKMLRHQLEPVLFYDLGGGFLKKVLPGERKDKFLAGIGFGLRINYNDKFSLRLDWAKRVGDKPTTGSGPSTFYLTFQANL